MAECREMREIISRFIDGELSPPEERALEQHLKLCPSCRFVLSAYENIAAAASESLTAPPESFTGDIMKSIKKLQETEKTRKTQSKTIKTIAATITAAAACLVLVYIVSPGLFGLTTKDTSMRAPESANYAKYDTMMEAYDEGSSFGNTAGSGSINGDSAAGDGASPADGKEEDAPIICASSAPEEHAPIVSQEQTDSSTDSELLKKYFAVFYIEGQLPDFVKYGNEEKTEDGAVKFEITLDTANALLEDGYAAAMGNPRAETALIVYTSA